MDVVVCAWAVDFVRSMRQRPLLARALFRIILGRYAYREFIGLMDSLKQMGYTPYMDYDLEKQAYHNDVVPCVDWWTGR